MILPPLLPKLKSPFVVGGCAAASPLLKLRVIREGEKLVRPPSEPGRELCSILPLPGLPQPNQNCVGCGRSLWLLLGGKRGARSSLGSESTRGSVTPKRGELWREGRALEGLWPLLQTPVAAAGTGQCPGELLLWQRWRSSRGERRGLERGAPASHGPRGGHDSSEIKHT